MMRKPLTAPARLADPRCADALVHKLRAHHIEPKSQNKALRNAQLLGGHLGLAPAAGGSHGCTLRLTLPHKNPLPNCLGHTDAAWAN